MSLLSVCRIKVTLILLLCAIVCNGNLSLNLEDIVKELQIQVKELQKGRQEDGELIRKLHEKVHRYVSDEDTLDFLDTSYASSSGSKSIWDNTKLLNRDLSNLELKNAQLKQLESELRNLKSQLQLAVDSDDSIQGPNVKAEVVYLRQELFQLKKMVEEMETRKNDENHASSGHVVVRWLQRTVEDLRHEMKEMASSLNTSAALTDKQRTETKLDLLKSDMSALGHRMDSVRVDRERNAALIQQLRQDVDELRIRLQEFASEQRKITVEVRNFLFT